MKKVTNNSAREVKAEQPISTKDELHDSRLTELENMRRIKLSIGKEPQTDSAILLREDRQR